MPKSEGVGGFNSCAHHLLLLAHSYTRVLGGYGEAAKQQVHPPPASPRMLIMVRHKDLVSWKPATSATHNMDHVNLLYFHLLSKFIGGVSQYTRSYGRIPQDEVPWSTGNFTWICQISCKQQNGELMSRSWAHLNLFSKKWHLRRRSKSAAPLLPGLAQSKCFDLKLKKTVEDHQKRISKLENKWQATWTVSLHNVLGSMIRDTCPLWLQGGLLRLYCQLCVVILGEGVPVCYWIT